jgi:hypothetical protein
MAFDAELETRRHWAGWQSFMRLTIGAIVAVIIILGGMALTLL